MQPTPAGKGIHETYMRQALELAKKGEGRTSPNPMVGCIAVKDGRTIAAGYHEAYGGYHAERNALLRCQEDLAGAELYVTLEPCCHHGKTPPCTDIIIEKGIRKVYVGCLDPNPKVAGKGAQILQDHGISVETGILEPECRALNEVFFHYMETHMPFLAMKYAMTLDGKIACASGDSKWVTGEESRAYVQRLRNRYRGIMAGIGTVLADDPLLNCRMEGGRYPVRIICDSNLRIPLGSQIVKTAPQYETILAYSPKEALAFRMQNLTDTAGRAKALRELAQQDLEDTREALLQQSAALLEIPIQDTPAAAPGSPRLLDLKALLEALAHRGIDSILLEGGGALNASALTGRFVQRVYAFVAPKLVAGADAKSPVEGTGIPKMSEALCLQQIETARFGQDLCISGRIAPCPGSHPSQKEDASPCSQES